MLLETRRPESCLSNRRVTFTTGAGRGKLEIDEEDATKGGGQAVQNVGKIGPRG